MSRPRAALLMIAVLGICIAGIDAIPAQVDQHDSCSIWAWITHNCAINPTGPCCPADKIKASGSAGTSGKAWHNNREACQARLESTYKACIDDAGYTRESCDENRRKGVAFCNDIEKQKPARAAVAAGPKRAGEECGIWAWLTHNCAINPRGPCCRGTVRSQPEAGGKAWHNNEEACLVRLEQTYQECVTSKDHTRESCDQHRSKGVAFCKTVEQKAAR